MKKGKRWTALLACLSMLMLTSCGAAEKDAPSDGEEYTADGESSGIVEHTETAEREETSVPEESAETADGRETSAPEEHTETETDTEMPADAAENHDNDGTGAAEDTGTQTADGTLNAEKTSRVEAGMKLSILGDSISTFEGWIPEGNSVFFPQNGAVKEVSQTWWKIVLDDLGLTLCTNGSSSGSACFGYSQQEDPMFGCSDHRISQLAGADGEAPDVIIIYMGTNDVLMSASIGDNDGLRPVEEGLVGSLSDGYTMILDKIKKRYPAAQVYCCTLLQMGDWGTTESQPFVPFVNGQNVTSEAYSEQIRLIAKNRGLPVIDLEKCGITIDNMAQMTADGVHPTPEGMRLIADTVKKSLTE